MGSREETDEAGHLVLDKKAMIKALKEGDEEAFRSLMVTYGARLCQKAEQMLGCPEDARECVQECFLQVHRNISDFREDADIYTWMHRILVNSCLMKMRTRHHQSTVSIESLLPDFDDKGCRIEPLWQEVIPIEDLLSKKHIRAKVMEGISTLPDAHRMILLLRDIEGYSTAEAAEILSISVSAAKVRLHRSRAALKRVLEPLLRGGDLL